MQKYRVVNYSKVPTIEKFFYTEEEAEEYVFKNQGKIVGGLKADFRIEETDKFKDVQGFIRSLKAYRLTTQQKKTLKGQALKGNLKAAEKGLEKIRKKNGETVYSTGVTVEEVKGLGRKK